jgi:predicted restriction endonuclease
MCDIHHVIWWEHYGFTDLANLIPLCNRHHHAVHDHGWQLTLDPNRILTIHFPDGTTARSRPNRGRNNKRPIDAVATEPLTIPMRT